MVRSTNSAVRNKEKYGDVAKDVDGRILKTKIKQFVHQILVERRELIKEKVQSHQENLEPLFSSIKSMISRRETIHAEQNSNVLLQRISNPLCKFNSTSKDMVKNGYKNNKGIASVERIKIPCMEKLPRYTSWIYISRNIIMAKDQSIIGKRQLGFKNGETVVLKRATIKVKRDFTKPEDHILWMALEEYGSTEAILSIVKEFIGMDVSDIQKRCEELKDKNMKSLDQHAEDCECKGCQNHFGICVEKSLNVNLQSLNNLFCRQCLIVHCPLHDSSQPLIYPSDKQPTWSKLEVDRKPCSDHCYLLLKDVRNLSINSAEGSSQYRTMEEDSVYPLDESTNSKEVQACKMTGSSIWKPLERNLCLKGIEIFAKNSCLIARNLLPGLKTCSEVAMYLLAGGDSNPIESTSSSKTNINEKLNARGKDQGSTSKSRSSRKKKNSKKLTDSQKSTRPQPSCEQIDDEVALKQYTPCGCHGKCIAGCPCLLKKTSCEKYCGCSMSCSIRFRGCFCSQSQCRTKSCPCFASNRECDPDICRNCWISCGGGLLGEPPRRGNGQCGNMNLLSQQKERILLSKSDIVGWGTFAKNSIEKDACLGEYTGDLINCKEANERGEINERTDSKFDFTLNNMWTIDSRHNGNKLKYANHSLLKANCYSKGVFVKGDHKIGIYAQRNIEAGEEIFYNYFCDGLGRKPKWALAEEKLARQSKLHASRDRAKKKQSR